MPQSPCCTELWKRERVMEVRSTVACTCRRRNEEGHMSDGRLTTAVRNVSPVHVCSVSSRVKETCNRSLIARGWWDMHGELHPTKRHILHDESPDLAAVFAPVDPDELDGFPRVFSAIERAPKPPTARACDRQRLGIPQTSQLHPEQALAAVTGEKLLRLRDPGQGCEWG
jgi:hypothetical protein